MKCSRLIFLLALLGCTASNRPQGASSPSDASTGPDANGGNTHDLSDASPRSDAFFDARSDRDSAFDPPDCCVDTFDASFHDGGVAKTFDAGDRTDSSMNAVDGGSLDAGEAAHVSDGYIKASNTGIGDWFGREIALSSDGTTLVIGAAYEDSNATGTGGNQADESATDSGAVYVFHNYPRGWVQEAYLKASNTGAGDHFGSKVALSSDGNVLAVAAHQEDSSATRTNGDQNDNSGTDRGAIYVFNRTGSTWNQVAYLKSSEEMETQLGYAMSLSSDGTALVATSVVGSMAGITTPGGWLHLFQSSGGTWSHDASADFRVGGCGASVTISGDGSAVAVGCPTFEVYGSGASAHNAGEVIVYRKNGTSWSAPVVVTDIDWGINEFFGAGVALSYDGSVLAVGHAANVALGSSTGNADIFTWGGSSWQHEIELHSSSFGFGLGFALSSDGRYLAVGSQDLYGGTGVQATRAGYAANSGATIVYSNVSGSWQESLYVKATNTEANDEFGSSVAISASGSLLVVGAWLEDSNAVGIGGDQQNNASSNSGAVYAFR